MKIGLASDPYVRLKELQVGSPYVLSILAHCYVPDAKAIEAALHGRFREYHLRGEWFKGSHQVHSAAAQIAKLGAAQRESPLPDGALDVLFSVPLGSRSIEPRRDPVRRMSKRRRAALPGSFVWRGKVRR